VLGLFNWFRGRGTVKMSEEEEELWLRALAVVPILQGLTEREQKTLISLGCHQRKRKSQTETGGSLGEPEHLSLLV